MEENKDLEEVLSEENVKKQEQAEGIEETAQAEEALEGG